MSNESKKATRTIETAGTVYLTQPIQINGKEVAELTYDMDEISTEMFAEAEANKLVATKANNRAGVLEVDYSMQLYLGFAAIIAINPGYDMADMERVKGRDVMQVMRIGRNFISPASGAENSGQSGSGSASGTTPEPSTPPS